MERFGERKSHGSRANGLAAVMKKHGALCIHGRLCQFAYTYDTEKRGKSVIDHIITKDLSSVIEAGHVGRHVVDADSPLLPLFVRSTCSLSYTNKRRQRASRAKLARLGSSLKCPYNKKAVQMNHEALNTLITKLAEEVLLIVQLIVRILL